MSHQNFRVVRNKVPILLYLLSSLQVKTPIVKPGLPWATPELIAHNFGSGIFQIVSASILYDSLQRFRVFNGVELVELLNQSFLITSPKLCVQWYIVIPSDYYFYWMLQTIHLFRKKFDFSGAPHRREVSSMDEHITIWHILKAFVVAMCV